jgi:hypothetical protein
LEGSISAFKGPVITETAPILPAIQVPKKPLFNATALAIALGFDDQVQNLPRNKAVSESLK